MSFTRSKAIIPVAIIGVAAVITHFLPSMVKPKKDQVELIPETQDWKRS